MTHRGGLVLGDCGRKREDPDLAMRLDAEVGRKETRKEVESGRSGTATLNGGSDIERGGMSRLLPAVLY